MCKYVRHLLIFLWISILCFQIASSQTYPDIPCPDMFKYINMSSDNLFGGLLIIKTPPRETTEVEVEFAQNEPIDSGKIQQDSVTFKQSERILGLLYLVVEFPKSFMFNPPMLIAIKVNHKTVCQGQRQGLDEPSTNFKHTYIFYPETPRPLLRSARNTIVISPRPPTPQLTTKSTQFNLAQASSRGKYKYRDERRPYGNVSDNRSFNPSTTIRCGREGLTPFVVGGKDFPRGKFPWLAAIYLRDSADLKFKCGGSLISSRTVITAAHCFPTLNFSPDLIFVYLGRHNLFVSEDGSQQRDVTRLFIHPDFNRSSISDADIALLHMGIPVEFSQYIRPICLWPLKLSEESIEGLQGYISGWGADNNGHTVTSVPKMVGAKIVSESKCLRSSDLFRTLTSSRSLCAGNLDGTGPCIGDSGGGLMLYIGGVWLLRGMLSGGKTIQRKCDLNEYVVYCDIAKHITWIHENM